MERLTKERDALKSKLDEDANETEDEHDFQGVYFEIDEDDGEPQMSEIETTRLKRHCLTRLPLRTPMQDKTTPKAPRLTTRSLLHPVPHGTRLHLLRTSCGEKSERQWHP